tara:strand:- start:125 stop:637 length:513 start_codon:yes stop_codon:yes gene_type:complete
MKKLLLLLLLAAPAQADMRHSITTSAKVQLDAAYSSAERIGTTYSVTGNNITPSTTVGGTTTSGAIGGLTADSVTAGVPAIVDTDFTITTAGSAVSVTESLTVGDAVQSATTVTGGVVPALPSLGSTVTGSGGVSGGTITSLSSGVHTCSGTMGAGSSCTVQTTVESVVD